MSLFFYLFSLAINLWHRKFVTAAQTRHCSVCHCQHSTVNMSNEDKILIKSSYLKGYTAKRLTGEVPDTPFTRYNRLSNGFYNRLDVCLHDTAGSQTGCETGCQFDNRFDNRVEQTATVSSTGCRLNEQWLFNLWQPR